MAPETRSRGVPPPSRVYNSTPTLQQVQFPSRKRKIRRRAEREHKSMKQQTLTQIEFVSSFDEDDVIALSESDDATPKRRTSPEDDDKENAPAAASVWSARLHQREEVGENEIENKNDDRGEEGDPTLRRRKRAVGSRKEEASKRRRTVGEDDRHRAGRAPRVDLSRRRTFGDAIPSTNYCTQTLTQFLGHHTSFVADSDDEQEEGFLSWLGEPDPGSPSAGRGRGGMRGLCSAAGTSARGDALVMHGSPSRENSVIPQTPARRGTSIRFEIPSGGLQSPSERMMRRHEAPDMQDSPSRPPPPKSPRPESSEEDSTATGPSAEPRRPSVIQDSYPTEGWTTPSKSQSQGQGDARTTPLKLKPVLEDCPSAAKVDGAKRSKDSSPDEKTRGQLYEVPDSDEDEGFAEDGDGEEGCGDADAGACETGFRIGVETQAIMGEAASTSDQDEAGLDPATSQSLTRITKHGHRQPSSTSQSTPTKSSAQQGPQPTPAGLESSDTTTDSKAREQTATKPIRQPLHHPSGHTQPSQPWESQRVPVRILQSLPAPSARSDIILPIASGPLESLATGYTTAVTTSFKIPPQVVRFWLLENRLLRYMACVSPGEGEEQKQTCGRDPTWRFHASQVYELNNPVQEQDMLEEGWIRSRTFRYTYLPPAVIGQLLWNLRHALFADPRETPASPPPLSSPPVRRQDTHLPRRATTPPGSMTVSQQIAAQIHSDIAYSTQQLPTSDDMIPSTPDEKQTLQIPPSASNSRLASPFLACDITNQIHPSQATTLSQASSPENTSQSFSSKLRNGPPPPPPLFNTSENSIQFIDTDSLSSLPLPSSLSSNSQLLTKSQLLPESLIHDHPPRQPEIWDSDDDDTSL